MFVKTGFCGIDFEFIFPFIHLMVWHEVPHGGLLREVGILTQNCDISVNISIFTN